VVTGEKIIPLQPMQVAKGCENGYPMLGGTVGPPYPESYKYDGLAIQDGVWVTGGQPVTVIKDNI